MTDYDLTSDDATRILADIMAEELAQISKGTLMEQYEPILKAEDEHLVLLVIIPDIAVIPANDFNVIEDRLKRSSLPLGTQIQFVHQPTPIKTLTN